VFNFLGRDFFNALSERDVDAFQTQLVRYLGGFVVGVPVFVVKRYFQVGAGVGWVGVCVCGGGCGGWAGTALLPSQQGTQMPAAPAVQGLRPPPPPPPFLNALTPHRPPPSPPDSRASRSSGATG
jgi:hypothetical protein